jgi:putative transposase
VRLDERLISLSTKRGKIHFWAIGYGAWSTGSGSEEMVQEYLEHHRDSSNQDSDPFILE